ncbi:DUF3899 domain-containing protein [Neobacillus sp. MM2021_6]|uniref:DUF3899 domain-containing protein n=1 Tax=Bacillaceae TaxID=186817 RepID=UPI001409C990|nr:DUF3899 domain-containing protein [Neobacillus sp. MM2021_6]NHC20893.1 DUF3899 domain-containing protein [Bacillus sp. MM2020_4]
MKSRLKKKLIILSFTQIAIIIISYFYQQEISLLNYINISFLFTAGLLLFSLLLYTIHSGFYDAISRSFNLFFSKGGEKRNFEDIPRLSEMITVNEKPLLFHGLMNGLFMIIALLVYYF